MLIITKVEVLEVDNHVLETAQQAMSNRAVHAAPYGGGKPREVDRKLLLEILQGRKFRHVHTAPTPEGGVIRQDMYIALSNPAQEALGLLYSERDKTEAELSRSMRWSRTLAERAGLAQKHRDCIGKARWWTRLKWVFTGIPFPEGSYFYTLREHTCERRKTNVV